MGKTNSLYIETTESIQFQKYLCSTRIFWIFVFVGNWCCVFPGDDASVFQAADRPLDISCMIDDAVVTPIN